MVQAYFQRQMILPEIGEAGQEKLRQASVLVVGAGALGCPVLQYLCAAGCGKIILVDDDVVQPSNLHRQVLFGVEDVGKSKAGCAADKLSKQFPWVEITALNQKFSSGNAPELLEGIDVVADCSDNFPTRYLVNDACVEKDIPFVSASILRFEGQLGVYNYKGSGTYRCLFPEAPQESMDCASAGVIGSLAGVMGSMQAMEILKVITGMGDVLSDKLMMYNGLSGQFTDLKFSRQNPCVKPPLEERLITSCAASEETLLVDVREPWEHEERNKGGINIPLSELPNWVAQLKNSGRIVLYCDYGHRSRQGQMVLKEFGIEAEVFQSFQ